MNIDQKIKQKNLCLKCQKINTSKKFTPIKIKTYRERSRSKFLGSGSVTYEQFDLNLNFCSFCFEKLQLIKKKRNKIMLIPGFILYMIFVVLIILSNGLDAINISLFTIPLLPAFVGWAIGFGIGSVLYKPKDFIGKHLLYKQHKRKGWTMHKPSARY